MTADLIQLEMINPTLAVVHLAGEVDVNQLSQLETTLKPLIADPSIKTLILHCRDLKFIDSKVVGFIAYLRTTFIKNQRELRIAETTETVNDILSLVGLNQIIPHFESLEAALAPTPS